MQLREVRTAGRSAQPCRLGAGERHSRGGPVRAGPADSGGKPPTGLKRGSAILYLKEFVTERFGSAAWDELVARLPEADRETLTSVVPVAWYDLDLHARLNREFCSFFRGGSLSIAQELGRFSADRDFKTLHYWMLRLVKPSFAIRNMNIYWRRGDETGHWMTEIHGNEVLAQLSDWGVVEPALCQRFLGYLGRLLEHYGPVTMIEHSRCRAYGAAICEFRFRWNLKIGGIQDRWWPAKADIPPIIREIAQCTNLDTFSDMITDLLFSLISCSQVKLWVRSAHDGAFELVRAAGETRSGRTYCFALERAGNITGRLGIEFLQSFPVQEEIDLLEDLLPAFATILDTVRPFPSHHARMAGHMLPHCTDPDRSFARRLLKAKERQSLTAREVEVLEQGLRGRTNGEIAEELGIKEGTVEAHMASIRRKFEVDRWRTVVSRFWLEL